MPVGVLTALILAGHFYYKNAFRFWKDRGIDGPTPCVLLGNFGQILADKWVFTKWRRQYGKVYGLYEGSKPVLVVSDPKLLGQICIKDFSKFPNHHDNAFNSELTQSFIFSSRDDHWRHLRTILSATFTSGKMRRMFRLLDVCADSMVEAMDERSSRAPIVNLRDLFNLYTMDAIASCCYAIRLASYKKETSLATAANRDEFVKLALKLFDLKATRIFVIFILHESILKKLGFGYVPRSVEWAFANKVKQIIKNRRESGRNFDDYLQTLIDAQSTTGELAEEKSTDKDLDSLEQHHAGVAESDDSAAQQLHSSNLRKKPLSELDVLAGATFLLVVGLETTSTLLTNCFYALAWHQDIQERLYQTIKSLAKVDEHSSEQVPSFDYESLISCQYLDAVISETLRLHPSLMQIDRDSSVDYHLPDYNLLLPKSTKVVLALGAIMSDPDYWPEPHVFNPERFMPENRHKIVANSYCPFGIGPRHCMGMRFSLAETKIAVAKLLMKYKFEPAPQTKYPPEPKLAFGLGSITQPEVKVSKR
jgi:cytochrome P450